MNLVNLDKYNFKERTNFWMDFIPKNISNFNFNFSDTILLVIDMQNYFLEKNSTAYFKNSDLILDNLNMLINFAESKNIKICYSIHYNVENKKNRNNSMINWWKNYPRLETKDCILSSKINYLDNSKIFYKDKYSLFTNTYFNKYLKSNKIKNIIISGIKTNLCCETTAREGFLRNYNILFVADATMTNNEFMHLSSLTNLSYGFARIDLSKNINKYFK